MDAATLKVGTGVAQRILEAHFRIFMDAATLQGGIDIDRRQIVIVFPHLYGCGHIEGHSVLPTHRPAIIAFPHLYGCGHIEGRQGELQCRDGFHISASLWMRPHCMNKLSIRSDVIVFHPCLQNLHPLYLPPLLLDLLQVFLAQDG